MHAFLVLIAVICAGCWTGATFVNVFNDSNRGLLEQPLRSTRLFIAIASATPFRNRRQGIRDSWLKLVKDHLNCMVEFKFFVGSPIQANETDTALLLEEQRLFNDLVVLEDAGDTRSDLSAKTVGLLRWAVDRFHFDWLLKIDDDSFLRPDRLLQLLMTNYPPQSYPRLYLGHVWTPDRKVRHLAGCDDYVGDIPPLAVGGCGYVLSEWLVHHLAYPVSSTSSPLSYETMAS